jgi:hypothetical protein
MTCVTNDCDRTYVVDSLSSVLRPRPRFYPVFGSEWTQIGSKFLRCEFTRITLGNPLVSVMEIYRQLTILTTGLICSIRMYARARPPVLLFAVRYTAMTTRNPLVVGAAWLAIASAALGQSSSFKALHSFGGLGDGVGASSGVIFDTSTATISP